MLSSDRHIPYYYHQNLMDSCFKNFHTCNSYVGSRYSFPSADDNSGSSSRVPNTPAKRPHLRGHPHAIRALIRTPLRRRRPQASAPPYRNADRNNSGICRTQCSPVAAATALLLRGTRRLMRNGSAIRSGCSDSSEHTSAAR